MIKDKHMQIRTFITEDAGGCEFEVTAYYNSEHGATSGWQKIDNHVYVANGLGVEATTLKELKRKVANL